MALLRERRDAVEIITFNRPDALNALNRETFEELEDALDAVGRDEQVGALVFTGAGPKAFVAGADIRQFVDLDVWTAGEFAERTLRLLRRIEEFPKPSVAAVNGFCLGGGMEFALSCDVRIGAENARFGQPEVNLGIIPGWGGTQRLQRLVGPGWARQMILTGDMIDAQTALRIGLINEILPQAELLDRAVQIAQRMGGRARRAVQLAKQAILRGAEMPLADGLQFETAMWQLSFETADRQEGVAAFLEKREAKFQGR